MTIRKLLDPRKALIYIHRWAGILLTAVFVIWFVSGVIFVYVGMPALSAEERLQRMEQLDLTDLRLTPADAMARAGLTSPSRVRIAMHGGRPVYRIQSNEGWTMIYADTGEVQHSMSAEDAMAEVRRFAPEHAATLRYERRLDDSDQWTLQSVIRTHMPMHRIALGDAAGTEVYVSERMGEPVMRTTASGRFWGYMSAVLHWLYFTPLRRQTQFWNSFVVWSSLIGTVMCAMGIVIGVWRYSIAGRFRLRGVRSHTPYTAWMKWHHYTGLVFGFFACTWAFSGALSLGPFDILRGSPPTRALREAATGGPIDLISLTVDRIRAVEGIVSRSFTPKELDFFQFLGEPYFIAYRPPDPSARGPWKNDEVGSATALHINHPYVMVSALHPESGPFQAFDRDRMWEVARAAMPGVPIAESAWLTQYDAYYYSHDNERRLPVLRVKYDDPQQTWLYLDPERGTIASRLERGTRWNRWLYHGFHSLDFPFLYYRRPLWDIVIIVLSVGGVAISVTSGLPAWRRLVKHGRAWRQRVRSRAGWPRDLEVASTVRHTRE